ncbi:hypothetical protein TNCV_4330521 [Trichonephila clavipes]|nr:hypothetical protein TNCV_4330521 [Trichonephila clavipes]
MADPDIKPLIEFMESSSNKPSWQDISAYSPTTKQYWAPLEFSTSQEWCSIPKIRIRGWKDIQRFCWGKVRADVEQWCKSCDACSARKGPKIRSRGKLHRYNVGAPFERIAFDILGPLPRTASGNKYLLVVMDYFTKWPEVYPFRIRKPHRSGGCSAALDIEIWVPLQLHSDQGRNFVSAVLKGVCELLGIDKTKTTPLHPQSDGMVERFNRTILNNLSLMVSKNQQDWDQKVPLSSASVPQRRSRDYRIFTIPDAFGRDLRLLVTCCLVALRIHLHRLRSTCRISRHVFEDVHNLARERINLRTEKMKTRYDTKATGHQFKEGDKVWFYNPTRRRGLSPKLQSHWDGPYTILKIINDVVTGSVSQRIQFEA